MWSSRALVSSTLPVLRRMSSTRSHHALLALVLAAGCGGPETTTARLAGFEPYDPDCEYERFTDSRDEQFVAHPLFGCVRAADLVQIIYDLTPGSDGRPRRGFTYGNTNGTQYTPRSVVSDLAVGSTFPATYEVRDPLFGGNGQRTVISIPELDDRVLRATPPLDRRECVGMRSAWE